MAFPEQLKVQRERLGLTQAELAALLEVSPRAVWQWEKGTPPPVLTQEGALARLMEAKARRNGTNGQAQATPPGAHCSPSAQRVREEIWAQFCDWWTGREHAKEVKDFAFTLFNIGYEAGEMANAPMKIMRERLLNWWRCDGGMDTLGQLMDDLEATINDTTTP